MHSKASRVSLRHSCSTETHFTHKKKTIYIIAVFPSSTNMLVQPISFNLLFPHVLYVNLVELAYIYLKEKMLSFELC